MFGGLSFLENVEYTLASIGYCIQFLIPLSAFRQTADVEEDNVTVRKVTVPSYKYRQNMSISHIRYEL